MDRLFITTKDRPVELAVLCKSLLHSDMFNYISEVVFLDDNSEEIEPIMRIYSAFMYFLVTRGVRSRFLSARDGRVGINASLERIKHYKCDKVWILNGDMMVFSKRLASGGHGLGGGGGQGSAHGGLGRVRRRLVEHWHVHARQRVQRLL